MPTAYSPLLGLALPVTGELAGTWGDTVNNYITTYLDSSVAGTQTISGSQTAVTLSVTNGTTLTQVGSGATGSAQYNIINCTGNPASLLTITAPAQSKTYLIINATSTNQSVKIVGTGPTTGVTLIAGERALVAWNGSDFIKVATTAAAGGSNTQVQFNSNGVLAGSANMTFNGTRLTVADFADSSLTSGRVTYAGAGGNLTDSANLLFDGTTLTANALTTTSTVTINGGTANGVAYLNGSKVLTTGSALSFDGTEFKVNAASGNVLIQPSNVANAKLYLRHGSIGNNNGFEVDVSSNTIFLQAGTEAMRLTSVGLGIGTSSPGARLGVTSPAVTAAAAAFRSGSTDSVYLTLGRNAYEAGIGVTGTTTIIVGAQPGDLNLYTNTASGAIRFGTGLAALTATLDSSGNLGIGTSSPVTKLNIASAAGSPTGVSVGAIRVYETTNNYGLNIGGDGTYGYIQGLRGTTSTLGFNDLVLQPNGGNLGLGVTPSAWNVGSAIDISSRGSISDSSAVGTSVGRNAYYNAGWKYKLTSASQLYLMDDGGHKFFTAPSGTAGNAISFTQAMTLDASGNLLVGGTSASFFSGSGVEIARTGVATLRLNSTTGGKRFEIQQDGSTAITTLNAADSAAQIAFATVGTERARITSGGEVLFGLTAQTNTPANGVVAQNLTGASQFLIGHSNGSGSGTYYEAYFYNSTNIGSITQNGTTGVLYNITSDYRLKNVVGAVTGAGERIDALLPVDYTWKADGAAARGFLAHEFQAVYPNSVTGTKDAVDAEGSPVYQQMQASTTEVIADLVAEIKSLRARVAALENA